MNDFLYPFIDQLSQEFEELQQQTIELPLYREIAWDFKKECPLVINNEFQVVTGNEAISVWIWHAIKTYRYAYSVYSWDFGSEIDSLLGQNYTRELTKAEVSRYIQEALLINPYILEVAKIQVSFDGDTLEVSVRVITIYEELEVNFIV